MTGEWRLASPDGVTFHTSSFTCAALVTLLVTGGKSAAIQADTGSTVPAFPNGGDGKWLAATFGKNWPELIDENANALAGALRSFALAAPSQAGAETVNMASRMANAFDREAA